MGIVEYYTLPARAALIALASEFSSEDLPFSVCTSGTGRMAILAKLDKVSATSSSSFVNGSLG